MGYNHSTTGSARGTGTTAVTGTEGVAFGDSSVPVGTVFTFGGTFAVDIDRNGDGQLLNNETVIVDGVTAQEHGFIYRLDGIVKYTDGSTDVVEHLFAQHVGTDQFIWSYYVGPAGTVAFNTTGLDLSKTIASFEVTNTDGAARNMGSFLRFFELTNVAPANAVDGTSGDDTIGIGYVDAQGDIIDGADGDDDTIYGYAGDDTIEGGAGADAIDGGTGTNTASYENSDAAVQVSLQGNTASGGHAQGDTLTNIDNLIGSDFNDTLVGDQTDNVIDGGAGDDAIQWGGSGSNTILGGDGDDVLDSFDFSAGGGNDLLDGGAGDDTFYAGDGASTILGGTGNDLIFAEGGNDTIDGGAGNDTIDGGGGDDIVDGGAGDDLLYAGFGSDQFIGGDGNDTYSVEDSSVDEFPFDITLDSATGDGDDTYANTYTDIENFIASDASSRVDTITFTGDVQGADVTGLDNTSVGTFTPDNGGPVINFGGPGEPTINDLLSQNLDGAFQITSGDESGTINGTSFENFETINFNVVCFVRGTLIKTERGEIDVSDLKVGDRVITMDCGSQPIRWIGSNKVPAAKLLANAKLLPIRIRAGALGNNTPSSDLLVSRQHRILVRSRIVERMFGTMEVLVPAVKLLAIDGIDIEEDLEGVEYWHFLFDEHQVVWSNDALTESLFTGPQALDTVSPQARKEIEALFPEILDPDFLPQPARLIPAKGKVVKKLIDRHQFNCKPIMELPGLVLEDRTGHW